MRQRLSSGEWAVMVALWRAGSRVTVDEVRAALEDDPREYRTIQTILGRCEQKGWARVERTSGRRVYYSPALSRRQGVEERTATVLAELTQGDDQVAELAATALRRALGPEPPSR